MLLRHSFWAADLCDCSLVTRGEHGNFRYAPRGLREQHEVLLVFTGRRVRILLSKRWSTVCKVMYYIALGVAPIFVNTDSGRKVKAPDLSSGAT